MALRGRNVINLLPNMFKNNLTYDQHSDRVGLPTTKGYHMAIFEFSDGFDAVGWYMEHPEAMEPDPYGWDYTEEYPF